MSKTDNTKPYRILSEEVHDGRYAANVDASFVRVFSVENSRRNRNNKRHDIDDRLYRNGE